MYTLICLYIYCVEVHTENIVYQRMEKDVISTENVQRFSERVRQRSGRSVKRDPDFIYEEIKLQKCQKKSKVSAEGCQKSASCSNINRVGVEIEASDAKQSIKSISKERLWKDKQKQLSQKRFDTWINTGNTSNNSPKCRRVSQKEFENSIFRSETVADLSKDSEGCEVQSDKEEWIKLVDTNDGAAVKISVNAEPETDSESVLSFSSTQEQFTEEVFKVPGQRQYTQKGADHSSNKMASGGQPSVQENSNDDWKSFLLKIKEEWNTELTSQISSHE